MNKRLYSIFAALLIAVLATSNVLAGGAIKLSANITSGSPLHLDGIITGGSGNTLGVNVVLTGYGNVTSITCTNPQGNQSPGQNPGRITVTGAQPVSYQQLQAGNVPIAFSAGEPVFPRACPNHKWTVTGYQIAWTRATIDIYDNALPSGSNLMLHQEYTCALQPNSTTAYACTFVSETRYF